MPHKHGKAGGAHYHAEDGEPHVSHAYRGVQAVPDAQHVAHGLEQGVGVLLTPRVVLSGTKGKVSIPVKATANVRKSSRVGCFFVSNFCFILTTDNRHRAAI